MVIQSKYEIGDTVYLKTDPDQLPRLVTSIHVNRYDLIYELSQGVERTTHYDFEIDTEKSLVV